MGRQRTHMEARCLGCGCTDSRACVDGEGKPCSWLKVDYGRGIGVCTSCPDKVESYDRQTGAAGAARRAR